MNFYAVLAIYKFEMNRLFRTLFQSLISPIISTSLYFVVFGTAIGSSIENINGISYGTFIVPGFLVKVLFIQNFPELWHTGTMGAPEIIPTLAKLALNLEGP